MIQAPKKIKNGDSSKFNKRAVSPHNKDLIELFAINHMYPIENERTINIFIYENDSKIPIIVKLGSNTIN